MVGESSSSSSIAEYRSSYLALVSHSLATDSNYDRKRYLQKIMVGFSVKKAGAGLLFQNNGAPGRRQNISSVALKWDQPCLLGHAVSGYFTKSL